MNLTPLKNIHLCFIHTKKIFFKKFAPDCPIGLASDRWKQWVPHPIFPIRSDSREQIIWCERSITTKNLHTELGEPVIILLCNSSRIVLSLAFYCSP